MSKIGLILEGGGMRGIYTAGVLDFLSGDVLVIRPKSPVKVSQIEKNVDRLTTLYEQGYNDAKELYGEILDFINKPKNETLNTKTRGKDEKQTILT